MSGSRRPPRSLGDLSLPSSFLTSATSLFREKSLCTTPLRLAAPRTTLPPIRTTLSWSPIARTRCLRTPARPNVEASAELLTSLRAVPECGKLTAARAASMPPRQRKLCTRTRRRLGETSCSRPSFFGSFAATRADGGFTRSKLGSLSVCVTVGLAGRAQPGAFVVICGCHPQCASTPQPAEQPTRLNNQRNT